MGRAVITVFDTCPLGQSLPGPRRVAQAGYVSYALTVSVGTMILPRGTRDTGISLKQARPSGMPMIVMQRATPATKFPMASQIPATISQMTLPITEGAPARGLWMIVRPNGQSA